MKNEKNKVLWNYIGKAVTVENGIITVNNPDTFTTIPQTFGFGETKKDSISNILEYIGEYGKYHLGLESFIVRSGPYIINFNYGDINSVDDNPAIMMITNGLIFTRRWYKDGKLHRDNDKPALVDKIPVEDFPRLMCWYKDGVLHRDNDKPASIEFWGDFKIAKALWYENGIKIAEVNITNEGEIKDAKCEGRLDIGYYKTFIKSDFPNSTFSLDSFFEDVNKTNKYEG